MAKKRSVGVMIFGIILILWSIWLAFLVFAYIYSSEAGEVIFSPIINAPLALLHLMAGIGIIACRKWARLCSLGLLSIFIIFSGLYTYFFLSYAVFDLFSLQPGTKVFIGSPPDNFREIGQYITIDITRDIVCPSIFILSIIISITLIFYLTRPKVKEQFK